MTIDRFISGEALDRLIGALLLIAPDGSVTDANSAALECYGYTRSEMLDLGVQDIRATEVEAGADATNAWELAPDGTVFEEMHRRSDGSLYPVEVRVVHVRGSDGETVLIGQVSDITDRSEAEAALRESEAKHASMISNISDVIGIMGADGFMKYKSPNIEKSFGWRPEDLVGTDGWLTGHPDDVQRLQREFFELLQHDGASVTVEYQYLCKDGGYKWIELTATNLVNDPIIGGVLLNYHDITERRMIEQLGRELSSTIDVIGTVCEKRDPYTAGHQRRVSELASAIARDMGMSEAEVNDVRIAGRWDWTSRLPRSSAARERSMTPACRSPVFEYFATQRSRLLRRDATRSAAAVRGRLRRMS